MTDADAPVSGPAEGSSRDANPGDGAGTSGSGEDEAVASPLDDALADLDTFGVDPDRFPDVAGEQPDDWRTAVTDAFRKVADADPLARAEVIEAAEEGTAERDVDLDPDELQAIMDEVRAEAVGDEPGDPERPTYTVVETDDAGLTLRLDPVGGDELDVVVADDEGDTVHAERKDRGFYNNRTVRANVAGAVVRAVEGSAGLDLDDEDVRDGVKDALSDASFDARDHPEAFEAMLRTDAERSYRERTRSVVSYPLGDAAEHVVRMDPPADAPQYGIGEMRFETGDLRNPNPAAFDDQHDGQFAAGVDLDTEEWRRLVDYWRDIAERAERDVDLAQEAVIERTEAWVRSTVQACDREAFSWHSTDVRGLYVEGCTDGDLDGSHDVLCVPNTAVADFNEQRLKSADIGLEQLQQILYAEGVVVHTSRTKSINGEQARVWYFDAGDIGPDTVRRGDGPEPATGATGDEAGASGDGDADEDDGSGDDTDGDTDGLTALR